MKQKVVIVEGKLAMKEYSVAKAREPLKLIKDIDPGIALKI